MELSGLAYTLFQGLINKLIHHVVSSYAKYAEKRALVAALLENLTNETDGGDDEKMQEAAMPLQYVYDGIRAFFIDVHELGMVEDNPKLWDSLADLLVHCLLRATFSWGEMNYLIPTKFLHSDDVWQMMVALFKRLKSEANAVALCCNGHFDILQKLFSATKTPERVNKFLELLKEAGCIDIDPSIFIYQAFKDQMPNDDLLLWLKSKIPEVTSLDILENESNAPMKLCSSLVTGHTCMHAFIHNASIPPFHKPSHETH